MSPPSRRKRFLLLLVFILIASVVAACGTDEDDEPTPTARSVLNPTITLFPTSTQPGIPATPLPTATRFFFTPLAVAPTIPARYPEALQITSPGIGATLQGIVTVFGSASHPDFIQYALEYGPDPNPSNLWYPVTTQAVTVPVINNPLGAWNTTLVPDGRYQLRLHVYLRGGREITSVGVNNLQVRNARPTNTPPPTNNPPIISPIAPLTLQTGRSATIALGIYDPDGDNTNFIATTDNTSVATVWPAGRAITVIGVNPGVATIRVQVTDARGGTTQTSFLTTVVRPPTTNNPPNIQPIPAQTMTRGTALNIPLVISDPDGDTFTFVSASTVPSVVTVSNGPGQSVTLSALNQGSSTITITATDARGAFSSTLFTVVVNPPTPTNNPPSIAAIPGQTLDVGQSRDISLSISDPDAGDTLTVSASSSDPSRVTVSNVSQGSLRISGVAAGSASITVTVRDSRNASASTVFAVTVNAPPPQNRPPTVDDIAPQTVEVGETKNIDLTLNDPDGDTVAFSSTSGDTRLVTTGAVDNDTLSITGVTEGTTQVTVSVSDGKGGSDSTSFDVTVLPATQPNNPPTISAIDDQTCLAGETLAVAFTADDADNDPLTVTTVSDPAGVATASDDGAGNLTIDCLSEGTTAITVTVDDSRGGTDDTTFDVNVGAAPPDADGDGIPDAGDNCINTANPDQANADGDALGDACDTCPNEAGTQPDGCPAPPDADGDGIPDAGDNCINTANPDQANADGDALGDACDTCPNEAGTQPDGCPAPPDADGDGVPDVGDNCVNTANPDQANADGDALGDACDTCPNEAGTQPDGCPAPPDADGDGIPDAGDNCVNIANPDQANADGDALGDACDTCPNEAGTQPDGCPAPPDADGDGVPDAGDNCVNTANPDQANADGDALGDACNTCPNEAGTQPDGCPAPPDADGDGVPDAGDNCVNTANPDQANADGDALGDACDTCPNEAGTQPDGCPAPPDADGDGVPDAGDNCVNTANPDQANNDGDALGNACDVCPDQASTEPDGCPADSDGDGVPDGSDSCPNEFGTQPDGCPLPDVDGDGVADGVDNCINTSNPDQANNDGDALGNACDVCPDQASTEPDGCPPAPVDSDGDGVPDGGDSCPNEFGTQPDGCPLPDADGDGVADGVDNCTSVSNPDQANADGDALGDACDACPNEASSEPNGCPPAPVDSDGDGVPDSSDSCPNEFGTQPDGCPAPSFNPNDYDEIPTVELPRTGEILANGAQNRFTFSVAGDETPINGDFLDPIAGGVTNYGGFDSLATTVAHYNDTTGSFTIESKAASDGWTIDELVNFPSPDPACSGQTPLVCELQTSQPSVLLILFSSANVGGDTAVFRSNLQALVNTAVSAGTIPVLTTIPDDTMADYNAIIVEVATNADVPLWNRYLSEFGKNPGVGGGGATDFSATDFVINNRNLQALRVLESIRQSLP